MTFKISIDIYYDIYRHVATRGVYTNHHGSIHISPIQKTPSPVRMDVGQFPSATGAIRINNFKKQGNFGESENRFFGCFLLFAMFGGWNLGWKASLTRSQEQHKPKNKRQNCSQCFHGFFLKNGQLLSIQNA